MLTENRTRKIKEKVLNVKNYIFNTIITNNINNDILFYTNNIVESFNNNINKKNL